MLICLEKNCSCDQHRLLKCIQQELNEEAKLLLHKLENVCQLIDTSKRTLLHYSVSRNNAEMTQHLIGEGCYIDAQDNEGITPLMLSMKSCDLRIAEILLKNNANIYLTDNHGMSFFQLVFRYCLDISLFHPSLRPELRLIIEMLFEKVNTDFSEGTSMQILLNASSELKLTVVVFGNAEVTKFILDNGYRIHFHESQRRYTALHSAMTLARVENAKILIEHGANVDALDQIGDSPLTKYTHSFEQVDEHCEVLKLFLKRSRRLSRPRLFSGNTDVEFLLSEGREETVRIVLLSDIDLDACCLKNNSILYYLIENRRIDNLDFLAELDVKFDVNKRSESGWTTLTEASRNGYIKKIEFLLEHGADVNATTDHGFSALSCAMNLEPSVGVKIIELLLHYGADVQYLLIAKPQSMQKFSASIQVVVAHLAMIEESLTDLSRNTIESNPRLKDYFDTCTKQLEEMKSFEVHGTVTWFKLLTDGEEKLVAYARNEELLSAFDSVMANLTRFEAYYMNTLQRRFSKAQQVAELQDKAALSIEKLSGLSTGVFRVVAYNIIDYLDQQDLRNLCQIERAP